MHISGFESDVEIPNDAEGLTPLQGLFQIALEARQPLEFVGIFVRRQAGAIGYIEIHNANSINQRADDALLLSQVTRFLIFLEFSNESAAHVIEGCTTHQCDTVVRLLPMKVDPPSFGLKSF